MKLSNKTGAKTEPDIPENSEAGRFFSEAGRGKALLHISSQARFNPGLILLMGDPGSGRRYLLQRVLQRMNQKPGLMGVIDQVVRTQADLFNAIADAFELEDIPGESPAALEERVLDFLQGSFVTHRPVVLAVADSSHFSLGMLEELIKLLKRHKKINLLLVGDMNLSAMIGRLNTENRTCHEVVLKPLGRGEIRQFINWRLPFAVDGSEFEDIVSTTQGNFALLEREAHKKQLARARHLAQKKKFPLSFKGPDRRVWTGLAAVAALCVLVWSFMDYWQRPPTQPVPRPVKVKNAPVPAKPPLPLAQRLPEQPLPEQRLPEQPLPAQQLPEPAVKAVPNIAKREEILAPELAAVETLTPSDETRVLSLPATHYTLQMMAAKSRKNLDRFVSEHPAPGPWWVVRTQRDGADWYLVLYGDYSGWTSSQEALAALPEDIKVLGPWARRVSEVQALVDAAR